MSSAVRVYALVVGVMDAGTGALLIAAPLTVLRWMRVHERPLEPIWLCFIGAFVLAVGLVYLYSALGPVRSATRLPVAIELTAIVRAAVGCFVGASILRGALPAAWLTVAATDLGLAGFQALLARRMRREITPW